MGVPARAGFSRLPKCPGWVATRACWISILAAWCWTASARGAGLTIITHGAQFDHSHPGWVDDMGAAIAARAGSAAIYSVNLAPSGAGGALAGVVTYESGAAPTGNSTNAEVVLKVFWNLVAGFADSVDAGQVAAVVTPLLLQTNLASAAGGPVLARPLAELPMHLIGHSRGGSVMSEIARQLATHGVWVDQLTTLDPHPVTTADCIAGVLCPGAFDPAVNVYDNVLFADNYYEIDDGDIIPISGEPIAGSAQEILTGLFGADGLPDVNYADHIEVHDWYYGTIDQAATSASGDPIPRAAWYPVAAPFTYARGFQFSRLAGGQTLREHPEDQIQFTGPGWKWTPGATRSTNYVIQGTAWPNVMLDTTNTTLTATNGQILSLFAYYQSANGASAVTLAFGSDADQNPYDNSATNIFAAVTNSAPGPAVWSARLEWQVSTADDGKYLYARITDQNGLTRYSYLDQPVQVISSAAPRFVSIEDAGGGAIRLTLTVVSGGSCTIQASSDLIGWTSVTNFISPSATVQFTDSAELSSTRRFYRALAP